MGVTVEEALTIRCPLCMAGPGRPCLTVKLGEQIGRKRLHQERIQAAGRRMHEIRLADAATYDEIT